MTRVLQLLNERLICFYPCYARIAGSVNAGIVLSQLIYWFSISDKPKIYKTDKELLDETALSFKELRGAKEKLKKLSFLEISREGLPAKTFYKLNWVKLQNELKKFAEKNTHFNQNNGGNDNENEPETINFDDENVKNDEVLEIKNVLLDENEYQDEAPKFRQTRLDKKSIFDSLKGAISNSQNSKTLMPKTDKPDCPKGTISYYNAEITTELPNVHTHTCEDIATDNAQTHQGGAVKQNESVSQNVEAQILSSLKPNEIFSNKQEPKQKSTIENFSRAKNSQPKISNEQINLPSFIDPELWSEYLSYKKERKEKLSQAGIKMKFSEWAKWHLEGINVNECIRQAMANEWQGVFKPRPNYQTQHERNMAYTRSQMVEFLADRGISL